MKLYARDIRKHDGVMIHSYKDGEIRLRTIEQVDRVCGGLIVHLHYEGGVATLAAGTVLDVIRDRKS